MMVVKGKGKWTAARLPLTLLVITFVLGACNTQAPPSALPVGGASGFEFHVDPQTGVVSLLAPKVTETSLQAQSSPSDTRILTPYVDIGLKDLSYQFVSPKKLIVRFRVENLTASDLEQPFFFTLSSESNNVVNATAPSSPINSSAATEF